MRQLNVTFDVILDDGEPRRLGVWTYGFSCIVTFDFNDESEKRMLFRSSGIARDTGYRVPNVFVSDMQADTP